MSTFVVLLRGINVGKSTRVPMTDLSELLTSLGCTSVKTLLNSGNVVVRIPRATPSAFGKRFSTALAEKFGWQIPIVIKTAEMFQTIADSNPFAAECKDASKLLIVFSESASLLSTLKPEPGQVGPGEKFALSEHAAYLLCNGPILDSVAGKALLSRTGQSITTRNWATVQKICSVLELPEFE